MEFNKTRTTVKRWTEIIIAHNLEDFIPTAYQEESVLNILLNQEARKLRATHTEKLLGRDFSKYNIHGNLSLPRDLPRKHSLHRSLHPKHVLNDRQSCSLSHPPPKKKRKKKEKKKKKKNENK